MSSATPPRLSDATLDRVAAGVPRPTYDRADVTVGIVHVGVGGFHRSHMAAAIDTLLNNGLAQDWGICGVGLLEGDRGMKAVLDEQDGLYTLVVKQPDGQREARVIGSIVEYRFAPDDPEAVLDRMVDPLVRIVSLTITEGGYNIDRVTGAFDASAPGVVADLVDGTTPASVFGFVAEALRRRRNLGIPPFTVLSCDNIQGNGDVAAAVFTAFADLKDPELGAWMRANVAFPNSMVDRITPVTTAEDVADAERLLGLVDAWPVVCEPFFQWVIEDKFSQGRPPFESAQIQLVDDVEPYELLKLRLLNASHQALCYVGYLAGHRYVHDAIRDPAILRFVRRYMDREATPTLPNVPGIDLFHYKQTLVERFANEHVQDTLARLCAYSSDRIPKWLVPVIRHQLDSGGEIDCAAAVVASWARYAEGVDESGAAIDLVDPLSEELTALALQQRARPAAFLENTALFGDLAQNERFRAAFASTLMSFHERGAIATLRSLG